MYAISDNTLHLSRDRRSLSPETPHPEHPASIARSGSQEAIADTHVKGEALSYEWEVDGILDETVIGGTKYYLMSWVPTLVAEHDAQNAGRLIEEWELFKVDRMGRSKKRKMPRAGVRGHDASQGTGLVAQDQTVVDVVKSRNSSQGENRDEKQNE